MRPIDINEDRRLRVAWCKYEIILRKIKNYYYKKDFIQEKMNTQLSRWEAEILYEDEIKEVSVQRRDEMNKIRREMSAERAQIREQEYQVKQELSANRAQQAKARLEEKNSAPPSRTRRSCRIKNKKDDLPQYTGLMPMYSKRGSYYV